MNGDERSPVVLDATVVSNFALTGSVGWLAGVLSCPVTVPAVQGEVRDGYDAGHGYLRNALDRFRLVDRAEATPDGAIGVVPLGGVPAEDAPGAVRELDRGEAHALYRAWPDDVLASDDLDAREVAGRLDVAVTGSLGVLGYGVERHGLSVETADEWLDTWREYGYYSPVGSVRDLVSDGDE
jgi:hypothetical protein